MSTVEKALSLLEKLSATRPEIGLSEFKTLTGLDKGTVYRYLTSLKNSGLLEQNPRTKAYRLGPAVIRLAAVREKTVPLISTVAPVVDQIAEEVQELVHASLPQKNGMTSLYFRDGGIGGTRVAFDEAEVLPFHASSSGLAYVTFAERKVGDHVQTLQFTQFTPETPADAAQLKTHLERTKTRGYAYSDQLFEADVCSIAVPFFDHVSYAIGALSVATPSARMTQSLRQKLIETLSEASVTVSTRLGGKIPADLYEIWTSG